MFINGVKITLIICLTILVSAVLLISYTEYVNRYSITPVGDNSIYIFDKKSNVLNKCSEKGCEVVETKLPDHANLSLSTFAPSKMFSADQNMRDAITKTEAKEEKAKTKEEPKAPEEKDETTEKTEKAEQSEKTAESAEAQEQEAKESTEKAEESEEFIE